MKTLTISFLIALFSLSTFNAHAAVNKDKNKTRKEQSGANAVKKQVEKHFFFPQNEKEALEGTADVMFQVYPDGDIRVLLVQTKNPLIRKFVERHAANMKVDASTVKVGQIFRYRLEFKKQ